MSSIGPLNSQNFIGYYMVGGTSPSATNCGTASFLTSSGTHVDCCPTASTSYGAGGCVLRMSCIGSNLIFALPTGTRTCASATNICHTQTVFNNYPAGGAASTRIVCGPTNMSELTLFRNVPAPKTTASSNSNGSQTSTPTITTTTTDLPPSAPADLPAATATQTAAHQQSKAWIAGVVIGPIALIVIAALIIYICLMKKKHKRESLAAPAYPTEYKHEGHQSPDPTQSSIRGGTPMQQNPLQPLPGVGYQTPQPVTSILPYLSQEIPMQQRGSPRSHDFRSSGFSSFQELDPVQQERHELSSEPDK